MKLVKLLANLGYGSRTQVERHLRSGAVTDQTAVVASGLTAGVPGVCRRATSSGITGRP